MVSTAAPGTTPRWDRDVRQVTGREPEGPSSSRRVNRPMMRPHTQDTAWWDGVPAPFQDETVTHPRASWPAQAKGPACRPRCATPAPVGCPEFGCLRLHASNSPIVTGPCAAAPIRSETASGPTSGTHSSRPGRTRTSSLPQPAKPRAAAGSATGPGVAPSSYTSTASMASTAAEKVPIGRGMPGNQPSGLRPT